MYELHKLTADYPMSFYSYNLNDATDFVPHWHENIELIHIIKGSARALLDTEEVMANVGDTLVVNTNTMHQFFSTSGELTYHCLIMSIAFLKQIGIDFSKNCVNNCVNNNDITLLFSKIAGIVKDKSPYYKPESLSEALKIAAILIRDYKSEAELGRVNKNNAKTEIVKKAISYMKKNFERQLTLEEICEEIGVSKCYFCHTFKEVTGMTATRMLNFIRCQESKRILMNSECNVLEAAYRCGFVNMSYFSKTYRSIMGHLPSDIKKEYQKEL